MGKNIGWHHPTDMSDQWDGFNDSGMEHFTGNPMNHLAREVVQNAYDAGKENETVLVNFKLRRIATADIPDKEELQRNIDACLKAAADESEKAHLFFKKASALLKEKKIPVLEITDSNTNGMQGPCVNGTPYYAFMKARGQSKKTDSNASGSFGIGKFAPYAVSQLRTLMVSTVYEKKSGLKEHLTQGKSILMSHDLKHERKLGIGFWGRKEKCQPLINTLESLPKWLPYTQSIDKESTTGSKLLILGFDEKDKWQIHLAVSIAENFFGAISAAKLNVIIDDKYELTENTIGEFFESEEIAQVITKKEFKNEPNQFNNCKNYLVAFDELPSVHIEESQTLHLGRCRLRIYVGEGLPKKVCVLRNGMFITDNLQGLKQFSDFKDFVAVFSCEDSKGNKLLRNMEPPRHDDFEPERLVTAKEQKNGRAAIRQISTWVREMLARHAKDPVSEVTEIDELRDFFGEEGESDTGKSLKEINPFGQVIIRAKPMKQEIRSVLVDDEPDSEAGDEQGELVGGGGADGAGGGNGEGGSGEGTGGSSGGGKSIPKAAIDLEHIRAILLTNKKRKLSFTPSKSGMARLVVREAGADTDYDFPIAKSSIGEVDNGCLILNVEQNERTTVDVEFNEEFDKALKVIAYAI